MQLGTGAYPFVNQEIEAFEEMEISVLDDWPQTLSSSYIFLATTVSCLLIERDLIYTVLAKSLYLDS